MYLSYSYDQKCIYNNPLFFDNFKSGAGVQKVSKLLQSNRCSLLHHLATRFLYELARWWNCFDSGGAMLVEWHSWGCVHLNLASALQPTSELL